MLMKYAVDQDGNLVHVEYVENGLACVAVCPDCGEPVIAKQGRSMDWFFSHRSGAPDCVSCNESPLHRAAKWLLRQEMRLVAPIESVAGVPSQPQGNVVLSNLKVERQVGLLTPDVLATTADGEVFAVEFAVTSFCNADKVRRFHAIGMPVLEIDLSGFEHEDFELAHVREAVCFDGSNRKWLIPVADALVAASSDAIVTPEHLSSTDGHETSAEPVQQNLTEPPDSERSTCTDHEVILIRRVPVHIRRLPWGNYSVWHPRNASVRQIVEPACREARGARWNSKYRNWLVGAESVAAIRSALLSSNRGRP